MKIDVLIYPMKHGKLLIEIVQGEKNKSSSGLRKMFFSLSVISLWLRHKVEVMPRSRAASP